MISNFNFKFSILNVGVLFAQRAQFSTPSNTTDINFRKLAQSKKFLSSLTGMSDTESTKYLKNYGCYCHIKDNKNVGALEGFGGDGLDELDEACRDLARAQKCFAVDTHYTTACSIEDSYRSWTAGGNTFCGDEDDADWKTRQDCRYDVCLGEQQFAMKVAELIILGFEKNSAFQDLSEADYAAKCQQKYTGGSNLSCCGTVPNRYPFNTDVKECCGDSTIATIGMC